jgi:hypothetical protein
MGSGGTRGEIHPVPGKSQYTEVVEGRKKGTATQQSGRTACREDSTGS